ncbi:uncharacterized protein LOC133303992 [Gastrolobium bilobum]|uniref:uncharacterized protein LOC133303992 n=1 Tax=Gastrolobium bilobum TaxID=150636 RepID=UPI002AB0FFC7|nr:uncharacterized protein LOC133303992 [Gastrolobium bilobum]
MVSEKHSFTEPRISTETPLTVAPRHHFPIPYSLRSITANSQALTPPPPARISESLSGAPSPSLSFIRIMDSNPLKEQEASNSIVPAGGNSYATYLMENHAFTVFKAFFLHAQMPETTADVESRGLNACVACACLRIAGYTSQISLINVCCLWCILGLLKRTLDSVDSSIRTIIFAI